MPTADGPSATGQLHTYLWVSDPQPQVPLIKASAFPPPTLSGTQEGLRVIK